MLAVRFPGDRRVSLEQDPDPSAGPGQVVIDMKASGICGSDLRSYRMPAAEREKQKINGKVAIAGHEPCGVVAEIGPGVSGVSVGDRVMIHHYSGCGRCKHCLAGWAQLCLTGKHRVCATHRDGGHSDYMVVEPYMCVPMPDELGFPEGAALSCGTGTAYQALKRLKVSGLDTLAVFGQGPVGLSATLLGTVMGARVIAVDPDKDRLELARNNGAYVTIDPTEQDPESTIHDLTHGEGADAALDATGIGPVRRQMIRSVRVWGRACLVGEGGEMTVEPTPDIIHRHLDLLGSWTFSTHILSEAAHWVIDRNIPLGDIITHRFPLQEAEKAYRLFENGSTGKVVFVWD